MIAKNIFFLALILVIVNLVSATSQKKNLHQIISDKASMQKIQRDNAGKESNVLPLPITSKPSSNPRAILRTEYGNIVFELFPRDAPKTVANFINLAKTGFYDNSFFYRYVAEFVVQGGQYNGASNTTVPLEYRIPNDEWTVGLARDNDPNSGSSEYFINLVNNSANLAPGGVTPNGYAVFARVIDGFQVIKTVEQQPTYYNTTDGTTEFVHFVVVQTITIV
jgi:peptidyl-prolyl cis-trans isomerase A (cyclophilin A)